MLKRLPGTSCGVGVGRVHVPQLIKSYLLISPLSLSGKELILRTKPANISGNGDSTVSNNVCVSLLYICRASTPSAVGWRVFHT